MATTFQLKRSSVVGKQPNVADLLVGELAVNLADGILYSKNTAGNIIVVGSSTTSNVIEGSNLYFTNTRAVSALTAGSGISIAANGRITSTVTGSGAVDSVNGQVGTVVLTTANIAESGNLYFTQARARESLSQGSGITYNQSTGVITANVTSIAGQTGAISNAQLQTAIFASNITTNINLNGIVTANCLVLDGNVDSFGSDYAGYRSDGTNIVLKGDAVGRSGIFFTSEKDGTNINQPTDFGYIQFHPHGIDGTTGESNRLVIGVANDASDFLVLQSPYKNGVKISFLDATSGTGGTEYTVWHAGNDGVSSGLDADLLDGLAGGGSGAYALKANNLSVFASTTSAQLASIISDETGTGSLVFNTSPNITGTLTVTSNVRYLSTNGNAITSYMLNDSNGTLSFEGTSGQLFSISDSLTGTIFSVNDISGIPSIEIIDTGLVKLAEYSGNVVIGSNTDSTGKLQVTGDVRVTGNIIGRDFQGNVSNTTVRSALSQGLGITYDQANGIISANVTSIAGQTGAISNNQLLSAILAVDGVGSTLDADLLDGLAGGGAGAYALKANNLSVFASTTSAQLAGVISDETGSGSLVFATSPTFDGTPQVPTAANVTSNAMVASTLFVKNAIANLIDTAPTTLDTLNELAAALNDDPNFATTTATLIGNSYNQANAAFAAANTKVATVAGVTATTISNAALLDGIKVVDGVGSGLDADLLNGLAGGGGGSYALKANNLSVFASTTSAQLAGVISDETGSGNLVFNASPTFTGTPLAPTAAIGTANTMIATTAFASNASALSSGVVNPSVVVGSYTNITGVGTIAAGTWQGSSISTTYTDAKITSTFGSTGAITNAMLIAAIIANDGSGSGIDADTVDGFNTASGNTASTIVVRDSSADITTSRFLSVHNGLSENFKVGDDAWIGDMNAANTIRIKGIQDSANAYIVFGTGNSTALGRAGTGALTYGGSTVWHAGNDGVGSGLDADVLDGLAGGGAGAYALKANNLSVFASTTSAQLAGVISDETGSGSLVFATSPTLAGTPQTPTAAIGTANTMIASTAFASNASALLSGVVAPNVIVGSYSSITGLGTLTALTISGNLTVDTNTLFVNSVSDRVGIGTLTPGYKLEVNGSFAATTKSFVIDHPTKPGKKLRYGSLEGPENGVYVRGKLTDYNVIMLPDYWTELVDKDSITVHLTPIGSSQNLYVDKIENNRIHINDSKWFGSINCFYIVYGERKDVEKLEVEI